MTNKECVECMDNKSIVYFMSQFDGYIYGVIIRLEPNNAIIEDKDGEHSGMIYKAVHKAKTALDDLPQPSYNGLTMVVEFDPEEWKAWYSMYSYDLKQIVSKKVDK